MDNVSFELLKLYSSRTQRSAQDIAAITNTSARTVYESVHNLIDKKYLKACIIAHDTGIFNHPYSITREGRIALEEEQKVRKDYNFKEFRAWITLAIAVAGFILSILALLK